MDEYRVIGHMLPSSQATAKRTVYWPHHPVVRESSQTTKLRVVFKTLSKTSTGL